jgi:hypothetical protein
VQRLQGRGERALGGRGHAGGLGQQAGDPAGLARVAADLGDGQAGRQAQLAGVGRHPGAIRHLGGIRHPGGIRHQAGHRLAVRVEQAGDADRAGRPGYRQQRPGPDQRGDAIPDRAGGQFEAGAPGLGGRGWLLCHRSAVGGGQQQAASASGLFVR